MRQRSAIASRANVRMGFMGWYLVVCVDLKSSKDGRSVRAARREHYFCYWPVPLAAASAWAIFFAISAFTASRLKLAPRCIGG